MKAASYAPFVLLMALQISCAANSLSRGPHDSQASPFSRQGTASANLAQPQISVLPMIDCVLVSWNPVKDADGYFVYRETQFPASHSLLGIGPADAEGFVDRDPPLVAAMYLVQAFKVSEMSESVQTAARKGAATVPSNYGISGPADAPASITPIAAQPVLLNRIPSP